jgi:hypothetical protein
MTVLTGELFLKALENFYNGTRKWGTVRVQIKRVF